MPLQKALALVGIAKQTAKGAAGANPAFAHGVASGTIQEIKVDQERASLTSASRMSPQVDRTGAAGGASFACRAHSKSMGLYLIGALGGIVTTGAGPYVHTVTESTDVPFFTVFGKYAGTLIESIVDCKIDELTISWTEAGPVEVEVKFMGKTPNFSATFTPVVDDSKASYFMAAGGTFKLDTVSATPVTARVKAGKVTIKNGLGAVTLSASIVPDEQFPAGVEVDWSLTIVPDTDLSDWRKVVTGSGSGTTISEVPLYGSAEVQFTNGADSLKLTSTRVAFMTDFPEADPSGGPVELELAGMTVQPSSGAAITAVLTNTQISY